MKKLIIVLVAGAFGLTSCNKEVKLENRLDGKWEIDSFTHTENSVVTFKAGPESFFQPTDTTYNESSVDPAVTVVTTGNIDFVSDDKLVMATETQTTIAQADGSTNVTLEDYKTTSEYYVSGEDEITIVDEYGGYKVFQVTTNEKDTQTWEHESTETENQAEDGGLKTTVTTTNIKYTIKLVK